MGRYKFLSYIMKKILTFFTLVVAFGLVQSAVAADTGITVVESGRDWKFSRQLETGWTSIGFVDSHWGQTVSPSHGLCNPTPNSGDFASPMWAPNPVERETVYFRKKFILGGIPETATIKANFDDDGDVYVNGYLLWMDRSGRVNPIPFQSEISQYLHEGANVIALMAIDSLGGCQAAVATLEVNVSFGETVVLDVPLIKQNNLAWANLEYDNASRQTLTCGTTLAQCGCVATSLSMLLQSYGITRDSAGNLTTPVTLNNYLNQDSQCGNQGCVSLGYAYGSVRWSALNNYSKAAHDVFGSPKIIFQGIEYYDEEIVKADLRAGNPVVIKSAQPEEEHWFLATGIKNDQIVINDPFYNRTLLSDAPYNNTAEKMGRFIKTNSDFSLIEIMAPESSEILVTDQQGRKTGLDPKVNQIIEDIPNSSYQLEESVTNPLLSQPSVTPASSRSQGIRRLMIAQPQQSAYKVEVVSGKGDFSFAVYGADRDAKTTFNLNEGFANGKQNPSYVFQYNPEVGAATLKLNSKKNVSAPRGIRVCRMVKKIVRKIFGKHGLIKFVTIRKVIESRGCRT